MGDKKGDPPTVRVRGTSDAVVLALELISAIMDAPPEEKDSATDLPEGQVEETVEVPSQQLGRIIGKQGATIKQLQEDSGAKVDVDKGERGDATQTVKLRGEQEAVDMARELINDIIEKDKIERLGKGKGSKDKGGKGKISLDGKGFGKGKTSGGLLVPTVPAVAPLGAIPGVPHIPVVVPGLRRLRPVVVAKANNVAAAPAPVAETSETAETINEDYLPPKAKASGAPLAPSVKSAPSRGPSSAPTSKTPLASSKAPSVARKVGPSQAPPPSRGPTADDEVSDENDLVDDEWAG